MSGARISAIIIFIDNYMPMYFSLTDVHYFLAVFPFHRHLKARSTSAPFKRVDVCQGCIEKMQGVALLVGRALWLLHMIKLQ